MKIFATKRSRLVVIVVVVAIWMSFSLRLRWRGDAGADEKATIVSAAIEEWLATTSTREEMNALEEQILFSEELPEFTSRLPGRLHLAWKPTPDSLQLEVDVGHLGSHRCVIGRAGPEGVQVDVHRGRC